MIPLARLAPFLLLSALALPLPAQTQPADDTSNPETTSAVSHKLVGYYPQWGVYDAPPYNVKNVITSGSAPLLTQLIYAFANIVDNKCASYDTWERRHQRRHADQGAGGEFVARELWNRSRIVRAEVSFHRQVLIWSHAISIPRPARGP